MKRYLYIILCAALLTSCVNDSLIEQGTPGDGKTINATFTLSPDFVEEIEVRSVAGVDEKVIKDLWVIQLNADGTGQLKDPQYITTGFTSSASDCKVTVPLLRQASKIYFIANTHDTSAYTGKTNSTDVEAVTMVITEDLVSANGIPMSGIWTGTPDLLGIEGRVSLSRAVAKVNFNLNASLPVGEAFSLESITVKQAPKTLQYYRASLESYPYPAAPTVMDYPATTYDEILNATSKSLWWYLPENARGTGTATIQTDKGSKLPTGQAAYCTYLEVKGVYEAGYGTYETIYKIYFGANNYNDYNVKRNTVYNIRTTIKGIDAADTRINSTDISIIVGMFGGWDDVKKEYTKLLEVQTVKTANDPGITWTTAAAASIATAATNKEYGPTNIMKLKTFSPDLANYPAAKYCADLGNGWYLPSQNQLMAIYTAHNGIPTGFLLNNAIYWSATEFDATSGWYVALVSGTSHHEPKANSCRVRCVRDMIPQFDLSPMVVTVAGKVFIDARNLPAGAITTTPKSRSTKATDTQMTTDNTVNDIASAESNKTVSHYFEVAKTDCGASRSTWVAAINNCKAYGDGTWRQPTQRELILIWILKDQLNRSGIGQFGDGYWSSTEVASTDGYYVNMSSGHAACGVPKKEGELYARCVRDATP